MIAKLSNIKDPFVGLDALIKIEKSNKSVELISKNIFKDI
jgi:hypothetical protein